MVGFKLVSRVVTVVAVCASTSTSTSAAAGMLMNVLPPEFGARAAVVPPPWASNFYVPTPSHPLPQLGGTRPVELVTVSHIAETAITPTPLTRLGLSEDAESGLPAPQVAQTTAVPGGGNGTPAAQAEALTTPAGQDNDATATQTSTAAASDGDAAAAATAVALADTAATGCVSAPKEQPAVEQLTSPWDFSTF